MTDPMTKFYRQFNAICDELFDSVAERRPLRPLAEVCGTFCDDCAECPATETWTYDHAPIPNPPADEHLCERCADRRRDVDYERKMEG